MLNWLSKSIHQKSNQAEIEQAVIHVNDTNPEITAEPIFDEEPALYMSSHMLTTMALKLQR